MLLHLVTTKSGKIGNVKVNYNASFGWQTKWRKRDVLNAYDYGVMMNEGYINSGQKPRYTNEDLERFKTNSTDWQDAIFNDGAPVANHEVSVSGATEKVNYYLSMGYYSQDGIVGGDHNKSNYRRLTLRSNTKYTLFDVTKERDWLNKLDITVNASYTNSKRAGIDPNTRSNGVLNSALTLAPTLPIVYKGDEIADVLAGYQSSLGTNYVPQYDAAGNLYMVPGSDYDNQMNPVAFMNTAHLSPWGWAHDYTANFAADLSIGYGFKYRISYGADVQYSGTDRGYTVPFYLTNSFNWGGKDGASSNSQRMTVWQLENVLSWSKTFGKHDQPVSASMHPRTTWLTTPSLGLTMQQVTTQATLVQVPVLGT